MGGLGVRGYQVESDDSEGENCNGRDALERRVRRADS